MKTVPVEIELQSFIPDIPGLTCRSRAIRSSQRRRTGDSSRAGQPFIDWSADGGNGSRKTKDESTTTGWTPVQEIDGLPEGSQIPNTLVRRGTGWL